MISNSGLISRIIFEKDSLNENPTPYSNIKKGIPIMAIAIKYGMKNDPPPFEYST